MESDYAYSGPSLRWRMLRWALIGTAIMVGLVTLGWNEENLRGKQAWQNYKRELEARGEKLSLQAYIPPPVPDDQNFAMTPFLAPLYDFVPDYKPAESKWRDTNGLARAQNFSNDLGSPKSSGDGWANGKPLDLEGWAVAIQEKKMEKERGKTKDKAKAAIAPPASRKEAATEILQHMEQYRPVLDELRTASARPYARFNIRYGDGPATLLPHLAIVKKLSMVFQLRASAELELGQTDAALADTRMIFYLADAIKPEPFLIDGLVRLAMLQFAIQPIWEGLAGHRWSDAQLAELQASLGKIDLLADFGSGIRGERAGVNDWMDQLRTRKLGQGGDPVDFGNGPLPPMPKGWIYQNQLLINRLYQEKVLTGVDPVTQQVDAAHYSDEKDLFGELEGGFLPYKIFAKMILPAVAKTATKFAFGQNSVNEALLGCALERYRLANGKLPTTLDALAPQFIAKVPHDIISGEPLLYRTTDGGQFVLYSVGWNEKDDGGLIAFGKGSAKQHEVTEGDWVWEYPNP